MYETVSIRRLQRTVLIHRIVQIQLRQQRLIGDTLKGAVFLGYTAFILISPPATFVLSTAFFCFIVTVITSLQCFSFAVHKGMASRTAA